MPDININDVGELEKFLQRLNETSKAVEKSLMELQAHNAQLKKVWNDPRGRTFTADVDKGLQTLRSHKRDLLERRLPADLRKTIDWAKRRA